MKQGVAVIIPLIILLSIAVFGLIFANIYRSTKNSNKNAEQYSLGLSGMLYSSFEESGSYGTYLMAKMGFFGIDNGYWESYSTPNAPSLESTKNELGEKIKGAMNEYIQDAKQQNLPGVSQTSDLEITGITINVDETKLFNGDYDNGFDFTATSTGSINLDSESSESETRDTADYNIIVDNWRFWYIYRKAKQWVIDNRFSLDACNEMPQFGVRGDDKPCKYPPLDLAKAKEIFEKNLRLFEQSFEKDGVCINGCTPADPDCIDGETVGECIEDAFCKTDCDIPDPDCQNCNLKDTYIKCNVEFLCGDESVWSKHEADNVNCNGPCDGGCIEGCDYHNIIENCFSGACDDPFCPKAKTTSNTPPCKYNEIFYTAGEYRGRPQDPPTPGQACFGLGSQYRWSLIAEITCADTKYLKPIGETSPINLEYKFLLHQYFKERYHPVLSNKCEDLCYVGGGGGGGGGGTTEPKGGGHSGGGGSPGQT